MAGRRNTRIRLHGLCAGLRRKDEQPCEATCEPGSTLCKAHGKALASVKKLAAERLMISVDIAAEVLTSMLDGTLPADPERRKIAMDLLDRAGLSARREVAVIAGAEESHFDHVLGQLFDVVDGEVIESDQPSGAREADAQAVAAAERPALMPPAPPDERSEEEREAARAQAAADDAAQALERAEQEQREAEIGAELRLYGSAIERAARINNRSVADETEWRRDVLNRVPQAEWTQERVRFIGWVDRAARVRDYQNDLPA